MDFTDTPLAEGLLQHQSTVEARKLEHHYPHAL